MEWSGILFRHKRFFLKLHSRKWLNGLSSTDLQTNILSEPESTIRVRFAATVKGCGLKIVKGSGCGTHLTAQLLPIPEDPGSNPIIGNFY